jgi:hypothetical protein
MSKVRCEKAVSGECGNTRCPCYKKHEKDEHRCVDWDCPDFGETVSCIPVGKKKWRAWAVVDKDAEKTMLLSMTRAFARKQCQLLIEGNYNVTVRPITYKFAKGKG